MKTLEKAGRKFDVPRLGKVQLREMRKKGFDLVQKAFRMGGASGEVPVTGDELEILLETIYPGRDADIDAIGIAGQIELASMLIGEAFGQADEIKN
jgi:hypothetical protein